ncbi:MAG: transporter [Microbacteriaceae bacterium]|nr:transporter [Microbacteriaceae bacterium]
MSDSDDSGDGSLTPRERRALSRRPRDSAITAVLATTGLVAAFTQTLVTPIIPRLPALLHATQNDATWVLTATLLAAAISIPIAGRLGDMFGKRRLLVALLGALVLGSIICALSTAVIPMIAGRVLQGVSLGVISLGISILRDVLHPKSLGGAVALVSATLGVGAAVGLPIAALIAQNLDFHYLFWLATLLGLVCLVLVIAIVPVSTMRSGGRFDFAGAIGFGVGLVCILLGISKGGSWGWTSPLTLLLLAGGVVVLVAWGLFELHATDPLVDLRVAARRPVLLTNLTSIAIGFGFFVTTAVFPDLLEAPTSTGIGLGLSLILASLCLMPLGLVMFVISPLAARLTAARGPRTSLIVGAAIVVVAFVVAIVLHSAVWHVILVSTIVGVGVGISYGAMPTLIMNAVPPTETAAANGLNSVMRMLGSTVAATIAGLVLASGAVIRNGVAAPTDAAYHTMFAIAAAVLLAGVLLAVFIPRRSKPYGHTQSIPVQHTPGPQGES